MKDFNWTTFTRRIAIKASLSDLYNAWTVPSEIEKWFLSSAVFRNSGGTLIDRKENVTAGSVYEWQWFLYDVTENGTVTRANGKDHLQFTFAGECLVDIHLKQQGNNVIVEITQSNIPGDDHSKKEIRLGCDSGWSFFLVNLKSIYEGGLDLRNKDTGLKGMLNN